MIEADLLKVLACPICEERPPLREQGDRLICTLRGHAFPVVNGIPHLLPESVLPAEGNTTPGVGVIEDGE